MLEELVPVGRWWNPQKRNVQKWPRKMQKEQANHISVNYALDKSYAGLQTLARVRDWV